MHEFTYIITDLRHMVAEGRKECIWQLGRHTYLMLEDSTSRVTKAAKWNKASMFSTFELFHTLMADA
jgi:hypothetical protein